MDLKTRKLNPLLGFIVDRWPARRLVFIGAIILGAGIFLLSRTQSLVMLYASFMIIGLGSSLAVQMVPTVVVARWFKHDIGKANGVLAMGMGLGLRTASMLEVLRSFRGLAHRTQLVAEHAGVRWYNDSKGTNVGACIAALDGLHPADGGRMLVR